MESVSRARDGRRGEQIAGERERAEALLLTSLQSAVGLKERRR
jgi:hypothetical protein